MRRALTVHTLPSSHWLRLPSRRRGSCGGPSAPATIALIDETGNRLAHVEAGTRTIVVTDGSIDHNFHLSGPGVDVLTEIEFVGTMTWTLTFRDGIYRFVCDRTST